MRHELPPKGAVIPYPYLWLNQARAGETEGRKLRPVCMVIRVFHPATEANHLLLLAISSKPPLADQEAIEIPETERRRGGLSRYPRAWVYVDEYNYDIVERSFYFDPGAKPLGRFSSAFRQRIARALEPLIAASLGRVNRTVGDF